MMFGKKMGRGLGPGVAGALALFLGASVQCGAGGVAAFPPGSGSGTTGSSGALVEHGPADRDGGMALGPVHVKEAMAGAAGPIRLAFRFLDGSPDLRFTAQVHDLRLSAGKVGPFDECTGVVSAEGISAGRCTGAGGRELLFETIAATHPSPPIRYCVRAPATAPAGETWVVTRAGASVVAARQVGDRGETFRATSSQETFLLGPRLTAQFQGDEVIITDGTSAPLRGTRESCPPPPDLDGPPLMPDAGADDAPAPRLDTGNGQLSLDGPADVPVEGPGDGTAPFCELVGPPPTVPPSFCGAPADFSFETSDTSDGVMGQDPILQRQGNCLAVGPCGKGMAAFAMAVGAGDGNLAALHLPPPPRMNERTLFAVMRFSDPKVRPKQVAVAPGAVMTAQQLGNGWVRYDADVTPGSNVYNVIITMPGPFQGTLFIDELDWDQRPP